MVNDYWRAAIVAGAKHLHLGQEDLVDADLREIRKAGLTLGISTHDDEELATALARQTRLYRARPDLSDHAEIDALRAAGHSQRSPSGRSASETSRWSRSAASSSSNPPRSLPPAPTRSPSSATSPKMPTPMRGCGNGLARARRPREKSTKPSAVIARSEATKQSIGTANSVTVDCFVASRLAMTENN